MEALNPNTIYLTSLWSDCGRPLPFDIWLNAYSELLRVYRENAVAVQLGADGVEIAFYESEARRLERLVYPS